MIKSKSCNWRSLMPRLTKDSKVAVGNKDLQIDDILKTIIYLPAQQVKGFFMEIGLKLPRELRMFVLREVLRERVIETRKSRLTLADELNYRLSWYTEFSETQLENLMIFFDDHKLDKDFLEDFWTDVISYMVDKQVTPTSMKKLVDLSITHVRAVGLELPNMKTYNREIKDIFFDSYGRIDGLAPSKFRPVLYKSSTLTEIRDLGSKYEVEVPRRLKKSELADIVIKEIKERGQHTEELENKIRSMSVLVLQRYAIDNDIKASTELKKEEIIEYILANASETKESYFVPATPDVYEKEVHEVSEEPQEEIIPTPIPIPVPQPVITPKVEEPQEVVEQAVVEEPIEEIKTVIEEKHIPVQTQYVQQAPIDLSELVAEIKKLREVVEHITQIPEEHEESKPVEIKDDIKVDNRPKTEVDAVILNSAEFYGEIKSLKKLVKSEEIDERERFIEQRKAEMAESGIIDKDERLPGELRFFGKVFKFLGKILWKILKVLLKFALIIGLIVLILFLIYGTVTHFADLDFLEGFNGTLNKIGGLNILDRYHAILGSLVG
jgi:hypothetical protein